MSDPACIERISSALRPAIEDAVAEALRTEAKDPVAFVSEYLAQRTNELTLKETMDTSSSVIKSYCSLQGTMTAEFQASLSPSDAVAMLKDGVRRSTSRRGTRRVRSRLLDECASGQHPYAAVLACIDSRSPVEQIFDAEIGDLFVARVAGNVASPELIGSLEYATKYAGSKAVLVLGHTKCGAVKGAWTGLQDPNGKLLTGLLGNICPAVDEVKEVLGDAPTSDNIDACAKANVRLAVKALREQSEIIAGLEADQKIAVLGAMYDIHKGTVEWLD